MPTIVQISNADKNLSLFSKGIKVAGLEDKLNELGPHTLMCPVNLAIGRLNESFEQLLQPAKRKELIGFLSGYIIVGKKLFGDFRNNQMMTSIDGMPIAVVIKNGETHLNGAKILAKDRQGSNGVVHLLDTTYKTEAQPQ
jgi:uncharacterized surface protein with fasciclin (FAS1) repeats